MELYIDINKVNSIKDGTKENPFLTIEESINFIRKNDFKETVKVNIAEGRYFIKESVRFDNDCNISYVAEGKNTYFDGGIVVDNSKVKKLSDAKIIERIIEKDAVSNIYEMDLSDYDISYGQYGTRGFRRAYVPAPNELFINNKAYNVAQYPKKDDEPIKMDKVVDSGSIPFKGEFDMRPGIIGYDFERADLWGQANQAYISGLFSWSYADDTIRIKDIDTKNKTITTTIPSLAGFKVEPFTSYKIINLLEELSEPGEYFVDPDNKKVYFYPLEELNENTFYQISNLVTPMVIIKNCENISFEGITFENSRGTGLYIEGGENCCAKDCTFRNLGMLGVQIGQGATALPEGRHNAHGIFEPDVKPPVGESEIVGSWHEMLYISAAWDNLGGKNNGIVNCTLYNLGTGGVILGGGNRKNLIPAGNYVDNCIIYDVNRLDKTYKAGVNICGVGNRVSHCDIYHLPGFAVYLHGNDHIIEYNKIHDVVKEVADAGAIYWGRDLSEVGNEIRYNFIYDISGLNKKALGVCAIYLDDLASFNKVYQNYFYNITQTKTVGPFGVVFWNCGGQTSVNNNLFIDCMEAICPKIHNIKGIQKELRADEFFKDNPKISRLHQNRVHTVDLNDLTGVDITSDVWKEKYPYLYKLYEGTYELSEMVWCNVTVYGGDEIFKDKKNLDFTLVGDKLNWEQMIYVDDPLMGVKEDRVWFNIVDFDKIGPQI